MNNNIQPKSDSTITYILEGGVGKFVAFSSILPALAEKNGGPVQIWGPHYQVFANNPHVKTSFDSATIFLEDPRIASSKNIVYVEPYKSNFMKGDQHLVESFCEIVGVDYDRSMRPVMYTEEVRPEAKKWLKDVGVTGKYIMIQFSGGQPTMNYAPNVQYQSSNPGKNYSPYFVNYIIMRLQELYPDVAIIDATLPNEPAFPGTIKCDQHWSIINELLKNSSGFIAIDSCLQHFSAAAGIPGVVIWGNTRWTQFGWTHHKNMTFHSSERFNDPFKIDINDPRNIMVDPGEVLDVFVNDVFDKKVNDDEVLCAKVKQDKNSD